MQTNMNQSDMGQRIAALRKDKGLTQEDVAKAIGISRTALTQIELGNRNVDSLELYALSTSLGFSIDDLFSGDFHVKEEQAIYYTSKMKPPEVRISIPVLQVEKFKNILLYILERCAGKPNVGETVLYKLLYFSDFNYYELYEEHLTGAEYRKLPHGPVPQKLNIILSEMINNAQLKRLKTEYHHYPQTRYLPLQKADLTQMKASEKDVIDRVIEQMSDWNATMISDYSHGDKPWKSTETNATIDYELVFYRKPPYSVRIYEENE